jgi:hypothetical protein
MVSVLLHGLVFGIAILTMLKSPRIDDRSVTRRYMTRVVKLQGIQPQLHWSPASGTPQPAAKSQMHAARTGGQSAAAAPKSLAYQTSAAMTLIQPDVEQKTPPLIKVPIPMVVMWTPPKMPVQKIVPLPSQPTAVANVHPSLAMPNRELHVSSVELSSTSFVSATIPVPASTTSPITVPGAQVPHVPATAISQSEHATPATVLSVSDVLPTQGIIALPPANQVAAASSSDAFVPGRPNSSSTTGNGTAVDKQNGSGSEGTSGDRGDQSAAATGQAGGNGTETSSNSESDSGAASGGGPTITRIHRPHDGHFGVVVVGASTAEEYPETVGAWADRLAYTVYLQVGETKNWILQYCLPRVQLAASDAGRPDAPWPYDIVTPHLAPGDSDADALLVHGFIDAEGKFEKLAIVFPAEFPQAKFVLSALQQWQFRPAAQNGKSTAVEVLLIIPEDTE